MARIFVIDDEAGIRETIGEVLTQDDGHEVIEASNGKEGLEAVFMENADLIICDRKMPEMSGYELLENSERKSPAITTFRSFS